VPPLPPLPPPAPATGGAGSSASAADGGVAAAGAGALPRRSVGVVASVDGVPVPPAWVEAVLAELLARCDRRAATTVWGAGSSPGIDRRGDAGNTGRWLAPRASPRPLRLLPDELAGLLALLLLGSLAARDALPIVARRRAGREVLLALRAVCAANGKAAAVQLSERAPAVTQAVLGSDEAPHGASQAHTRGPVDWEPLVAALGECLCS
jgi:hypothetical protein